MAAAGGQLELNAGPARSGMPGLRNPLESSRRIRAVLFDLDGTLYRQTRMRILMAVELSTLALINPFLAPRRLRGLREYRHAQETLRRRGAVSDQAVATQLDTAAVRAGVSRQFLEQLVNEWMVRRPLKYMRFCRAEGLIELLEFLERRGLPVGVFSDYPADAKLHALGLTGRFSLVLCSTDPDIGALKPNPRGFLLACRRWNLHPQEVLMVGDRTDVDATGAMAAGMPCVIVGTPSASDINSESVLTLPSLQRLRRALDDNC
jgi:putative hydrolase of the HAD superfamily